MRFEEHDGHFSLVFSNGVSVQILKRGTAYGGLGEVRAGRRKLRSADLPILPLVRTVGGCSVARMELRHIQPAEGSLSVAMTPFVHRDGRTEWPGADNEDRWNVGPWVHEAARDRGGSFELDVREVNRTLGGIEFVGFSYGYRFRSRKHRAYRLHDRATWELGGRPAGNSFWMSGPFGVLCRTLRGRADRFSTSHVADADGREVTQFIPFFTALQAFTFQFDRGGLLVTTFERPFHCRSLFQKSPGDNFIVHWHQLCGDSGGGLEFPALQVLYTESAGSDDWQRADQYCAVREELQSEFRRACRLSTEGTRVSGVLLGGGGPRATDAERGLDALAKAGCKRVCVPGMMEDLTPREESARAAGPAVRRVQRLVEHAHRRGVEVAVSLDGCLLPWVFRACADDKSAADAAMASLPDELARPRGSAGLAAHMARVARELSIDALYCAGPFSGAGHEFHRDGQPSMGRRKRRRGRQDDPRYSCDGGSVRSLQAARIDLLARLHRGGYGFSVVGAGGMGGIGTVLDYAAVRGAEFMLRDHVVLFPYDQVVACGDEPLAAYFRGCAQRVSYAVTCDVTRSTRGGIARWWRQSYAAVNHAWHAVMEHMERSTMLPHGRGVLWQGPAPDVCVIWSFADFTWRAGRWVQAFDVMASRPVATQGGAFQAAAWHVYLVQSSTPW